MLPVDPPPPPHRPVGGSGGDQYRARPATYSTVPVDPTDVALQLMPPTPDANDASETRSGGSE